MQGLNKILEEIDEMIDGYRKNPDLITENITDFCYGLIRAKDIIRRHMNDGWIPVEERLPEDGTYLCTLTGELCGIDEPFVGMCGIENGIWDEPDCVLAWMPLPEPHHSEIDNKSWNRLGTKLEPTDFEFDQATLIAAQALEEIQQYREIGTVEECREAIEKQIPKIPDYEGDGYADGYMVYDTWICPNCGAKHEIDDEYEHCPKCGQAISWMDENLEVMEDDRTTI